MVSFVPMLMFPTSFAIFAKPLRPLRLRIFFLTAKYTEFNAEFAKFYMINRKVKVPCFLCDLCATFATFAVKDFF